MEDNTEIKVMKLRVDILEKQVEKIIDEIGWAKWGLIGLLLAESPQALNALKGLSGN